MAAANKNTDDAKGKALDAAIAQLEKNFGKGSIMSLGDRAIDGLEVISTGALPLDIALGIGGIPRGRVVEIYGPEASGKTTFCYMLMASAQRDGGRCAFIDTEHSLDPEYAAACGVNPEELLISQPDTGEQALETAETLIRSGALSIVVIDSVAALVPKAELDGEMSDSLPGLHARMMSKALRKLVGITRETGTILVFTNQLREKIGVMFGSPETTPGGKALKFYASVRLDIRRIETLKDGTEAIGNRVRVKVVKNKVAPPFRQAEFEIIFGKGFDQVGSLIDLATDKDSDQVGMIEKAGSFFTFVETGEKRQGRSAARDYLRENPELAARIEKRIKDVKLGRVEAEEISVEKELAEADAAFVADEELAEVVQS